jgi:hypothetical protein
MRLGDFNCGCEDRKFVMFTAGKLGLTEAALLSGTVLFLLIAWRINHA